MRAWNWLIAAELPPARTRRVRRGFLALLGGVYLSAFASLAVQILGLVGSRGIAPASERLAEVAEIAGAARFWRLPTLFWLVSDDWALVLACALGVAASLGVIAGLAPRWLLAACWMLYLSLASVGGVFLLYQWDALLLEVGFAALFLAPAGLGREAAARAPVSRVGLWLVRLVLFKLMFLSGFEKLASGDPTWHGLSALELHYWTQPLPTWISWYADRLPAPLHAAGAAATLAIELLLPWLIFAPRRLRWLAAAGMALLQVAIAATGNYGFFNLLTLALCFALLDDAALRRLPPWLLADRSAAAETPPPRRRSPLAFASLGLAGVLALLGAERVLGRLGLVASELPALRSVRERLAPFHVSNGYGLFAVMTTARDEIELEGSRDGVAWRSYAFRWKPGPPERRPGFAPLHMPRLDWQLWFAALRGCAGSPWLHAFLRRVLEGEPAVLDLLAGDPFAGDPPRYLRTTRSAYRFAAPGDAAWWRREPRGRFCPTVELVAGRLVSAELP